MARVYISATRHDLAAECKAVKAWLANNGHEPKDSYSPDSRRVLPSCLADIDDSNLYLLIQGHYYGDRPVVDNPEDLSYTHLEFRHARNKPRIVLRRDGIPDTRLSAWDDETETARVRAFHAEVDSGDLRPARFNNTDELLEKLGIALTQELRRLSLSPGAATLREPLHRASRDLLAWTTTLPGGAWLPRPELAALQQRIRENSDSLTLVLGEPGCGKSALLARLGQEAEVAGMPVLGIKADFLPEGILTQQDLGHYLDLPVSLLAAVQALAEEGPVLVLLDQLDALADLVVQRSARLRVLLDLIRDLARLANVHVVASCRAFEQRHDPSLRNLEAESLTLDLPAWEEVDKVLQQHGVWAGGWNAEMRETLRSPHALDTFLSLLTVADEPGLLHGFLGMLQEQWEKKVLVASGERRALLLDIARRMAEQEMLTLPLAWFEAWYPIVLELVADGLLRLDPGSGRLQFRHQTLYEFVRARGFLDEVGSLTLAVLAGQNSLRIRPQLWYALNLARQVAPELYQQELNHLWQPDLRRHLRMLLIEFLGIQQSPLLGEIGLAWRNFDDPWFPPRFLGAVVGSRGWFEILAPAHLPMLMARPAAEAGLVLPILERALAFAAPDVLALLDMHWLPHPDKDVLSWRVLAMGRATPIDAAWVGRLERIVSRTDLANWTINDAVSQVSAVLPDEAPRLVTAWLGRQWHQALAETPAPAADGDEEGPVSPYLAASRLPAIRLLESRELHDLPAIAEAAPESFIAAIWPLFLEMLETVTYPAHEFVVGYRGSSLQDDDPDESEERRIERPLLEALFLSVSAWAQEQPDAFLAFARIYADRDSLLAQRLLAKGLVQCAGHAASEVLEFLCGDPRRLVLGPYTDQHRDSKNLIQALAPLLDPAQLQRLEKAILNWHHYSRFPDDDVKTRRKRLRWDREHRLRLLRSLPREFMSPATRRLVDEEERAFPDLDDFNIRFTGIREVVSTVRSEQMSKASDEDIVKLFTELTDQHSWDHPRHELKGGSIQAGRELAKLAETNTQRAVSLIRHLQPGLNESPVGDVLRVLPQAGYDVTQLYALTEELVAKGFNSEGFHQDASHAIHDAVCAEWPAPDYLLDWIENGLVDVDPASEVDSEIKELEDSLLWGYGSLSTQPAGNYAALAALSRACLVAEPPRMDRWLECLERHLGRSESPKVWAAIAYKYLRWLHLAEHTRAQAFLQRLFQAYPGILHHLEGAHFMFQIQHWITPEYAHCWLSQMESLGGQAAQGAGEILMLRHAWFPEEPWPRARIGEWLADADPATAQQRMGMAYTVARLWSEPQFRELAHAYLLLLMKRSEEHVLKALRSLFHTKTLFPDHATWEWLDALCVHPALLRRQAAENLGELLEELVAAQPELIVRLCHVILDQVGEDMGNMATGWYLSGEPLTAIALALQDMGDPYREAGITLFERLLEFNLPQAQEMTICLDKRTPNKVGPVVPRRRRRHRRKAG